MNQELLMNPNCLVAALEKPAAEFTKADIISFIQKNNIRMVNFMYPAADGRLKTLNFVINNAAYLWRAGGRFQPVSFYRGGE